jgi:AAA15 family ATPase/GTPase
MQRYFEIKNFRNIGLSEPQKLILNSSLNQNELGNVIYIVGPNNSGKSNVLDALEKFGMNQITKNDVPDFDDSDPQPELRFVTYNEKSTYSQKKTLAQQSNTTGFFSKDDDSKDIVINDLSNEAIELFKTTINWIRNQGARPTFLNKVPNPLNPSVSAQIREVFKELNLYVFSQWGNDYYYTYINGDRKLVNTLLDELRGEDKKTANYLFEQKYGYNLIPNFIRFKNTDIKQSQFIVSPSDIKSSQFFLSLFSLIDYNVDEIISSYVKYNERKTRGTLVTTQNKINLDLEKISAQFNKLYLLEQKKYKFEIILDPTQISFQIYLDELTLNFDSQSTGFKWFFNFYLTLTSHKKLSVGDIIIMDEPATNLHVKGIEELRDFIRDYAKKSKLTFVISTHSPFFIDVDYLENVRIVNRINNESIIMNKFSFLSNNDIDSLGHIKSALTVSRHILLDPLKKTIFVEGITDYCYLTAFKDLFNINEIAFLPIDGLNDEKDAKKLKSDKDLFEALLKIDKFPTLLVDADLPGKLAKQRAEEKYSGRVEVISIDEFSNDYKEIEDLFDTVDKVKKNFDDAVQFKNNLLSKKISPKTKENFKNFLNKLCD